MKKVPNARWIRLHTIAIYRKGQGWQPEGIIALVDKNEAGVVEFSCDSCCDFEMGVHLTEQPSPEQLFDIPEHDNPWRHISLKDYLDHPQVKGFSPDISWLWEGTKDELFFAAKNNTDLMFPNRKMSEKDADYKEMSSLYAEVRKYLVKKERKRKRRNIT